MRRICATLAVLFLAAGCTRAESAAATGQETTLLSVSTGRSLRIMGAPSAPLIMKSLPSTLKIDPKMTANGVLYAIDQNVVRAFDLETAKPAWTHALDQPVIESTPFSGGILILLGRSFQTIALSRRDGKELYTLGTSVVAGERDGVLFVNGDLVYRALNPKTGREYWHAYGAGERPEDAPLLHDGVLLQHYIDSGAILHDDLFAFDARTGRSRWVTGAKSVLGFNGKDIYVNSTWEPLQLDNYVPLSVARIDLASGDRKSEYTYAPDPGQNAATYRNTPSAAFVAAGYVYLGVNSTWYRYDSDTPPAQAHPMRFGRGFVVGTFNDGRILYENDTTLGIGRSSPSGILLEKVETGALVSPIGRRADDTRYAVVGNELVAFERDANVRAVGTVQCSHIEQVLPWSGYVALICGDSGKMSELLYRDAPIVTGALQPANQPAPKWRVSVHSFQIPPHTGFMKQWWVGSMAPMADGGVAFALSAGSMNMGGGIGRITRQGAFSITRLPDAASATSTFPPRIGAPMDTAPTPGEIVVDTTGTLWFNDLYMPTLTSLSPSGLLQTQKVGDVGRRRSGIRLAVAKGAVWYARSLPTAKIVRADGRVTVDIPQKFGHPLVLRGSTDGTLWFLTQTALVRMIAPGKFTAQSLPKTIDFRQWPSVLLESGNDATMWLAQGPRFYQLNAHGIIGTYQLPNATVGVRAMVQGCDGALYIGETARQLGILRPGNEDVEEYPIPDLFSIDGLTRTRDCRIWFIEGSNAPTQHVGTLYLTPSSGQKP